MRRLVRNIAVRTALCLAGVTALVPAPASRRDAESPVRFREHLIDTIPGAYHATVADINGDGKPDIVAISETQNVISWYENPTWKKHVISTAAAHNIDVEAYDLEKTGKPDIFIASQFDMGRSTVGGNVMRLAPTNGLDNEWTVSQVGQNPTAHRIRWIDWDGNGKPELVVVPIIGPGAHPPTYAVPTTITSYTFHGFGKRAKREPTIALTIVDQTLHLTHGVKALDFDGNGREDLLIGSLQGLTLFRPVGKGERRTWTKTLLTTGHPDSDPGHRGCGEVDRGWLGRKRPFLATVEPMHGNEVVVYLPPKEKNGPWERHVIDDTLTTGHAVACVDLDGDGRSEIVAGGKDMHNLYGYRCVSDDGTRWERFTIDNGDMSAAGAVIADINGDGKPDIVAVARMTGKVKYYENLGK